MGGLQIPSCYNCRHREKMFDKFPCSECDSEFSQWKSKRGAKPGAKRKPGAKKTGPKEFEDRGELRQYVYISLKANDIKKAGGYKKVKTDLEKAFCDKIK